MRTILKILTGLWIAFWLYVGIGMFLDTPKEVASSKKFVETEIKPSVDFVKNFRANNGRLPDRSEYYTWENEYYKNLPELSTKYYIRKTSDAFFNDSSKFKNADWKKDFAIGVWNGEWTEYYFSWTDEYFDSYYTWKDGFIILGVGIGMGILPLLFWWFSNWRKRKSMLKFVTTQQ